MRYFTYSHSCQNLYKTGFYSISIVCIYSERERMNRLNKLKVYLKDKTNTLFNTITDRLKRYIFGTEEDRSHYTELLPFIFTAGELALIGLEEPEESVLSSVNLTGISV